MPTAATCTIAGCSRPHKARGLCRRHYNHAYRNGVLDRYGLNTRDEVTPPVCVCDEPQADAFGQCATCYLPFGKRFAECRDAWRRAMSA